MLTDAKPAIQSEDTKPKRPPKRAFSAKDYAALLISIFSFCVSSLGLYFTHFRQGHVQVRIGDTAHLYHPRDGGTAVYLPVYLLNDTPVKGVVQRAFLQIETNGGQRGGENYLLRWQRRATIDQANEYKYVAEADSFYVEGKNHSRDVFWFWWPEYEKRPLLFEPDQRYTFRLFVWTNDRRDPSSIDEKALRISKETAKDLAARRLANDPQTRIQAFENRFTIGIFSRTPQKPFWWRDVKESK